MGEKDDGLSLGLSLSLKCSENYPPPPPPPPPPAVAGSSNGVTRFPLNLLPSPPLAFVQRLPNHHQKLSFMINHALPPANPPPDLNTEARSYGRGIDVNRPPSTSVALTAERGGGDDDALVSSPNSTVSSVSGKRIEREENEAERESSSHGISGGEEEEDGGDASAARKKLRLSKDQAAVLEETFKEHNTLNPKQKLALAKQLDLRPRQVEVWFQNRRARWELFSPFSRVFS